MQNADRRFSWLENQRIEVCMNNERERLRENDTRDGWQFASS